MILVRYYISNKSFKINIWSLGNKDHLKSKLSFHYYKSRFKLSWELRKELNANNQILKLSLNLPWHKFHNFYKMAKLLERSLALKLHTSNSYKIPNLFLCPVTGLFAAFENMTAWAFNVACLLWISTSKLSRCAFAHP